MPREPLLCLLAALGTAANEARRIAADIRAGRLGGLYAALQVARLAHQLQEAALEAAGELPPQKG